MNVHPRRKVWHGAVFALALCMALVTVAGRSGADTSPLGPYLGAPFTIEHNGYAFGQAASWSRDGRVLSGQLDSAGVSQIYRSNLDGRDQQCLTCRTVQGPNAFPQERPQADWILFDSYGQQPVHTGSPGFGGYGGDLYVMREDGSHPYRLTTNSDPDDGKPYPSSGGVPYDNFHAYWSPNGRQIVVDPYRGLSALGRRADLGDAGRRLHRHPRGALAPGRPGRGQALRRLRDPTMGTRRQRLPVLGRRRPHLALSVVRSGLGASAALLHASVRPGRLTLPPGGDPDQRRHTRLQRAGRRSPRT